MKNQSIQILALLMMLSSAIFAENIYKSVDEYGRVTYSSTPPENSQDITTIEIQPPPSQEQIDAAQQRHESNLKAAELLDANRKTRDEITAEENRLKLEKQKQSQNETPKEEPQHIIVYPYNRPRYPGMKVPPVSEPPHRPDNRPPNMRPPGGHHPNADLPLDRPPATERPSQLPLPQPYLQR
jgi:hypothetical protein